MHCRAMSSNAELFTVIGGQTPDFGGCFCRGYAGKGVTHLGSTKCPNISRHKHINKFSYTFSQLIVCS